MTLTALVGLAAAVGCVTVDDKGDDGDSEADDGSGSTEGSGSNGATSGGPSGSYTCCINGQPYACPDEAAVNQCIGFDMDACMSACGFDDVECQDACFDQLASSSPDPSACTADASIDCGSATSGSGSGAGSGSASGAGSSSSGGPGCSDLLTGCDYDSDCCSGNCADNTCWGTSSGDPCEYDSDCDTGNCYEGYCQ